MPLYMFSPDAAKIWAALEIARYYKAVRRVIGAYRYVTHWFSDYMIGRTASNALILLGKIGYYLASFRQCASLEWMIGSVLIFQEYEKKTSSSKMNSSLMKSMLCLTDIGRFQYRHSMIIWHLPSDRWWWWAHICGWFHSLSLLASAHIDESTQITQVSRWTHSKLVTVITHQQIHPDGIKED